MNKTGYEELNLVHLASDKIQWPGVVNTEINPILKTGEFLY
jgi:hypothetical protein